MLNKQQPTNTQTFAVVIVRREDGQFYAGRAEGHELATERATSLGTPVAGKGDVYPLLGNFAGGVSVQLEDANGRYEESLTGLPVIVEVTKEFLRNLNADTDRRLLLTFNGVLTGINLEAGTLQGSSWVKPVGAVQVSTPGIGLVDRVALASARAEALKGAAERRDAARAMLASAALARRPGRVAK